MKKYIQNLIQLQNLNKQHFEKINFFRDTDCQKLTTVKIVQIHGISFFISQLI